MNTWPKAARFIRLTPGAQALGLRLEGEANGECYGAFKGASRQNFSALLRLLWGLERPYADLPRSLLCERAPRTYEFPMDAARPWLESLRALLRGDCDGLLQKCSGAAVRDKCAFHGAFRAADLLALEHFFRIGPERNRALREQFGAQEIIPQPQLDDLLVRSRHRGDGATSRRPRA
jgi:hypothetical protein